MTFSIELGTRMADGSIKPLPVRLEARSSELWLYNLSPLSPVDKWSKEYHDEKSGWFVSARLVAQLS